MSDISDEIVRAAARAIHRYDMEHALSTWPVPNDHHRAEALAAVTAVYPLLRAQVREEVARDIEAAPDAVLPPSSVDRSRVAAIARGVAADATETEFIGGAA